MPDRIKLVKKIASLSPAQKITMRKYSEKSEIINPITDEGEAKQQPQRDR